MKNVLLESLETAARRILWKMRLAYWAGNLDRMDRLEDRYYRIAEWLASVKVAPRGAGG